MFGKKKDCRTISEINEELLLGFADSVTEKIKSTLVDNVLAIGQRNLTEVLNAHDNIDRLKQVKSSLEDEVAKLKSKARLEETEFKGLMKLREDRLSLELEKKQVAMEKDFNKKEMSLLKEGHERHVIAIEEQTKRLDVFMKDAMDCLKTASASQPTVVK